MKWNLPNKISLLRVILIPIFVAVLLGGFLPLPTARWIGVVIFIVASVTDALDGYIARKYNLVTNLGKFLDPLADKLLVASALIAMVSLGDLPAVVVIVILSREFIITAFRTIAATSQIILAAGIWGKAKTAVQMVMIVCVLLGIQHPIYQLVCQVLVWLATILTLFSGYEYIARNIDVLKKD